MPQKKNRFGYLIAALFLFLSLQIGCQKSTGPYENIELVLTNGHFQMIPGTAAEVKYYVGFDYLAKGGKCKIGGFGIEFDDGTSYVQHWYQMQTLTPDQVYSISDTLRFQKASSTAPKAVMQGYFENSTETDPRLRAECRLKMN